MEMLFYASKANHSTSAKAQHERNALEDSRDHSYILVEIVKTLYHVGGPTIIREVKIDMVKVCSSNQEETKGIQDYTCQFWGATNLEPTSLNPVDFMSFHCAMITCQIFTKELGLFPLICQALGE